MTTISNRDQLLKKNIRSELGKLKDQGLSDEQIELVHKALKAAFSESPTDFDQMAMSVASAIQEQLNPALVESHAKEAADSAIKATRKDFEDKVVSAYLARIEESEKDKERLLQALEASNSQLEAAKADKDSLETLVKSQSEQLTEATKIISSFNEGELREEITALSIKVEKGNRYQRRAGRVLADRLKSDRKSEELVAEHLKSVDAKIETIKGIVGSGFRKVQRTVDRIPASTVSAVNAGLARYSKDLKSLRKTAQGMVGLLKNIGGVYENLKTSAEESAERFTGKVEEGVKAIDQSVEGMSNARKQMDSTASYFNNVRTELSRDVGRLEQAGQNVEFKVTTASQTLVRTASTEFTNLVSSGRQVLIDLKHTSDEEVRATSNEIRAQGNVVVNEAKANMETVNGLYDELANLSSEVRDMKNSFDPETAKNHREKMDEIASRLESLESTSKEGSYQEQIDSLNRQLENVVAIFEDVMNPERNNNNEG